MVKPVLREFTKLPDLKAISFQNVRKKIPHEFSTAELPCRNSPRVHVLNLNDVSTCTRVVRRDLIAPITCCGARTRAEKIKDNKTSRNRSTEARTLRCCPQRAIISVTCSRAGAIRNSSVYIPRERARMSTQETKRGI